MKRQLLILVGLAAASAVPVVVWAQAQPRTFARWDKIEISVTAKLSPNLYVLQGSPEFDTTHPDAAGGRVAVLFGPDGVLMVDSQDEELGEKVLGAIRTFTNGPIRVLVNSHIHPDHTGGNALFGKQGAIIFAREELRDEMLHPPTRPGTTAPAPDPAGLPTATYRLGAPGVPAVTLRMNGEVVDFIPVPASHTGGDTVVRFQRANAIYIGDFYRNYGYPFADQANGGSVAGMIVALDLIEKLADPNTTLVAGHGTNIKKPELLPYRAMILDIQARVKGLVDRGASLQDVLAANLTAPYDATTKGDSPQSKTRFITEVFNEAKGVK
jgi:cyclase